MFKTRFEEIVDVTNIGRRDAAFLTEELFQAACNECQSSKNAYSLLLAIDEQNSFMEGGTLGVPGSLADVERLCRFIHAHSDDIANITVSLDTHFPYQIFFPVWWNGANGQPPAPFTTITSDDIASGKWTPASCEHSSFEYIKNLERLGKKTLTIWPYHCISGTIGYALENMFSNMLYFFSAAKRISIELLRKGDDPLSEMYGIIRPEYSPHFGSNLALLDSLRQYKRIFIAGEAASHCVLESVKQLVEHYHDEPDVTSKIFVLTDCMSSIPGHEAATETELTELQDRYKIRLVKSTDETFQ